MTGMCVIVSETQTRCSSLTIICIRIKLNNEKGKFICTHGTACNFQIKYYSLLLRIENVNYTYCCLEYSGMIKIFVLLHK
jgi:hypothetical protein